MSRRRVGGFQVRPVGNGFVVEFEGRTHVFEAAEAGLFEESREAADQADRLRAQALMRVLAFVEPRCVADPSRCVAGLGLVQYDPHSGLCSAVEEAPEPVPCRRTKAER